MEQNTDHKTELKEKLITFYNSNKSKIYSFIIVLVIILISTIFIKINNQKKRYVRYSILKFFWLIKNMNLTKYLLLDFYEFIYWRTATN